MNDGGALEDGGALKEGELPRAKNQLTCVQAGASTALTDLRSFPASQGVLERAQGFNAQPFGCGHRQHNENKRHSVYEH